MKTDTLIKLVTLLMTVILTTLIIVAPFFVVRRMLNPVYLPPVTEQYEMIIYWEHAKPDFTTAGPFDSFEACDRIAARVLREGTGWKGWTCLELSQSLPFEVDSK